VTDPRVYFAAERTLLAWIRTGLGMMGFGFVVARFANADSSARSPEVSLRFGTALVLMGTLVNLAAALQHTRLVHRLRNGSWSPDHTSRWGTVVAIALALVGVVVTTQLLFE
jgi:putative membrane protein